MTVKVRQVENNSHAERLSESLRPIDLQDILVQQRIPKQSETESRSTLVERLSESLRPLICKTS
jgi:replication-associated recombination protein RarA